MERWNVEDLTKLKSYFITKSKSEICGILPHKSWTAINKKAKKLGLLRRSDNDWSDQELEKLRYSYSTTSNIDILKLFPSRTLQAILVQASNLGLKKCSDSHIRRWHKDQITFLKDICPEILTLKKSKQIGNLIGKTGYSVKLKAYTLGLGYKTRESRRKNKFDGLQRCVPRESSACEKLLLDIPQAYYWTGFIMADGHLDHKRGILSFRLLSKDKEQVAKLAEFLEIKNRITHLTNNYRLNDGNFCTTDGFRVSMGDVFDTFCKKFGFNPRKTYNPPRIENIPNTTQNFLSFVIGIIDGDGNIHRVKDRPDCGICIKVHSSWLKVLEELDSRLYRLLEIESYKELVTVKRTSITKDGYAELHWTDTRVLRALKLESNNLPVLARKWTIIDESRISRREVALHNKKAITHLLENGKNAAQISEILELGFPGVARVCRIYKKERNNWL